MMAALSFLLVFYNNDYSLAPFGPTNKYLKPLIQKIKEDKNLAGKKFIITNNLFQYSLIPYLKNANINFVNYCNASEVNYNTISFLNSEYCHFNKKNNRFTRELKTSQLNKIIDNEAYIFTKKNDIKLFKDDLSGTVNFNYKLYKTLTDNFYIYQIVKQ